MDDALGDECAFCRIANGDDTSAQVLYSEPGWLAFFPEAPATIGHTLVIPRKHVPHFWALNDEQAGMLAAGCLRIGRAIQRALAPEGMNLITSRGRAAEQSVSHVHLHVLPRWADDPVAPIWPPKQPPDLAALLRAAERVRGVLLRG
jgi:diadenosine tetraphosphate (Ap4A) HIT family hydrolase